MLVRAKGMAGKHMLTVIPTHRGQKGGNLKRSEASPLCPSAGRVPQKPIQLGLAVPALLPQKTVLGTADTASITGVAASVSYLGMHTAAEVCIRPSRP